MDVPLDAVSRFMGPRRHNLPVCYAAGIMSGYIRYACMLAYMLIKIVSNLSDFVVMSLMGLTVHSVLFARSLFCFPPLLYVYLCTVC